jgi:tetratricopeptide (TPR) repeat protein
MRDRRDRFSCAAATASGLGMWILSFSATQQRKLAANMNRLPWERDLTMNDVDSDNFGESTEALAIYEESLNFRRRLAKIDPWNSQWQRDGAYFLDRIGDEYRKVGMNQRAIAAYEESLAVWRQLAKIDWRNPQRQLNISVRLNKLGDVKLDTGDDIGALAAYEESLIIRRRDPNSASRQLNIAESLEKIGELKLAAGDIDGALVAYREMLSIDRRLVAIHGSSSEWQRNLLRSLERFGDVTLAVGDKVAAVAAYEQSVALRRSLAASGDRDAQWQKELSASLEKIRRLMRWTIYEGTLADDSQLAEADKTNAKQGNPSIKLSGISAKIAATELTAQQKSLAISRQMAESDPGNTNYVFDISTKLEGVADVKLRSGDAAGALATYEKSLALRRGLADADRASKKLQQAICNTLEKIGDLKQVKKDDAGALVLYEESLGLRRQLLADGAARNMLQTEKDNVEWQRDLSGSWGRLANATLGIGALLHELSKFEETYAQAQRDVSLSLEKVGDAKLNLGDDVGAVTAFEESLAIRRAIVERDRDNAQRQRDVLLSLEKVANGRVSTGDADGGLAAFAEILAITRKLLQTDTGYIESERDVSVTWDKLTNATLGVGAVIRKLPSLSLAKLSLATTTGLVFVGGSASRVRAWVRGLERSAAMLRKYSAHYLPKLIVAARRQSRRYLRTGSVIVGRFSAYVRAWVCGLPYSTELKGLTLKCLLLAPSSSHKAFLRYGGEGRIPRLDEPIGPASRSALFQHEEPSQGQSAVFASIREQNGANNLLAVSASSTGPVDESQATSVNALMVMGDRACKMDVQTQEDQSLANTRSAKRRHRKRKRRGASHCLPASQRSDMDRVRTN